MVVAIVAAVASIGLVMATGTAAAAREQATTASLTALRDATVGTARAPGYFVDLRALPATVTDLLRRPSGAPVFDAATSLGWRGPYVHTSTIVYAADVAKRRFADYAADGDSVPVDGWGGPIVLQIPNRDGAGAPTAEELLHARLVSPGPDGVIDTPRTDAEAAPGDALFPSRALCNDDIVLYVRIADGRPQ